VNPVKAIFFDIDGTLLSFKTHRVPESTVDALTHLRAAGIKVFVATGRTSFMAADALGGILFDGYITCNGAFCMDGDGRKISATPIPQSDLDALAAYLDNHSMPVAFMSENEMTVSRINHLVREAIQIADLQPPRIQNPREAIRQPIYQACLYADDAQVHQIMQHVMQHCSYSRWTHHFTDVNVSGCNKQSGIEHIRAHYGIRLEETMAFGDGGNDVSMLKHVATGVAMGNAPDEVKKTAAYVTASVDDDGISRALKHFGVLT
jgi:Cof subfamily protein (haloacid dehalogenase superfamily)